jgi:hypothetical protein
MDGYIAALLWAVAFLLLYFVNSLQTTKKVEKEVTIHVIVPAKKEQGIHQPGTNVIPFKKPLKKTA